MDNKQEDLITMDSPDDDPVASQYLANISIPSALITKDFGDKLKKALSNNEMVTMKLDWRESLPHPDERVEYEFWTNSNDECGPKCDAQVEFVRDFKGVAQILERGGYTQFTPHYITWYCPQAFIESKQCKAQCINNGRYCAPDPEQDFTKGYDGKQVVTENLRQLCVFKATNESSPRQPWKWWDFVTDFQIRCPMKDNKYGPECAEEVIRSLCKGFNPLCTPFLVFLNTLIHTSEWFFSSKRILMSVIIQPLDASLTLPVGSLAIDVEAVRKCMGDPNLDADNPVLKNEQDAQVGQGTRGDVTILPTLIVNQRQYRGL